MDAADHLRAATDLDEPAGEHIAAARDALDWSRADLASRLGCSHSAVVRWERGNRRPGRESAVKLQRLANRLDSDQTGETDG